MGAKYKKIFKHDKKLKTTLRLRNAIKTHYIMKMKLFFVFKKGLTKLSKPLKIVLLSY